jgi:methylenetetrahydrofolate reductase (NADPH)
MNFQERLAAKRFTITAEINPPKGTDLTEGMADVESLKGRVDALTVTDGKSSVMTMSALAYGMLLKRTGMDVILFLSCRDRNRLALQADLLGAAALEIRNVVAVTGDYASLGDHPQTKPVFDLDSIQLLRVIRSLEEGQDMGGNPLRGGTVFFAGATVSPIPDSEASLELQWVKMEKKIAAGARFFLTQPVFDLKAFERFMKRAAGFGVPVLASVLPLKSASMARFVNKNLPGISVPEAFIEEIGQAPDRGKASIAMSGRILRELSHLCQGVHLVASGWERKIPAILEAAKG